MRYILLLATLLLSAAGCDDQPPCEGAACDPTPDGALDGPAPDVALDVGYDAADVADAQPDARPDGPPDAAPDLGEPDVARDAASDVPACALNPEVCNAADDDCDGEIDEGLGLGDPCMVGTGACAREGFISCGEGDSLRCFGDPGEPSEEVCNQLDDDCDGRVDEGLVLPDLEPLVLDASAETVTIGLSGTRVGLMLRDSLGGVEYFGFRPVGGAPIRARSPRLARTTPRMAPDLEFPESFATAWIQPAPDGAIAGLLGNEFRAAVDLDAVDAVELDLVAAGRGLYAMVWAPEAPATGPSFQFMDDRFRALGPPSELADHLQVRVPRAAVANDEIGVVWVSGEPPHVYFRAVTDLGPEGAPIQVSQGVVEPDTEPRIATDGASFVVVWHDQQGVQLAHVGQGVVSDPVRLARGRWANVAYDGQAFGVVWAAPRVNVARLDAALDLIGAPVELSPADGSVEIVGLRGEFIVGWVRDDAAYVLRREFCVQP